MVNYHLSIIYHGQDDQDDHEDDHVDDHQDDHEDHHLVRGFSESHIKFTLPIVPNQGGQYWMSHF